MPSILNTMIELSVIQTKESTRSTLKKEKTRFLGPLSLEVLPEI
jgi:hypothetical protein